MVDIYETTFTQKHWIRTWNRHVEHCVEMDWRHFDYICQHDFREREIINAGLVFMDVVIRKTPADDLFPNTKCAFVTYTFRFRVRVADAE